MADKKAPAKIVGKGKVTANATVRPGPKPYSENPDNYLTAIRLKLGLTQLDMAQRMGLGMSSYQNLEADEDNIKNRHRMVAQFIALQAAVERGDPSLVPEFLRDGIKKLAKSM